MKYIEAECWHKVKKKKTEKKEDFDLAEKFLKTIAIQLNANTDKHRPHTTTWRSNATENNADRKGDSVTDQNNWNKAKKVLLSILKKNSQHWNKKYPQDWNRSTKVQGEKKNTEKDYSDPELQLHQEIQE